MPTSYTVQQGDCLASIAGEHGGFWKTIWNDPSNAKLRETRKDPNQLVPGDVVQIPEPREKQETRAAEAAHRFRRKGVPSKVRIRVLREGEPRKNQPFRVDIDGCLTSGTTDADGLVEVPIPGDARKGTLFVGTEPDEDVYELRLGHLEPISEVKGVKQRLDNLGYPVGEIDGEAGETLALAVKKFQSDQGLEASGKLDDATRQKIESVYGW